MRSAAEEYRRAAAGSPRMKTLAAALAGLLRALAELDRRTSLRPVPVVVRK